MRRMKKMITMIACVAIAMVMLSENSFPSVYAAEYGEADVETNVTIVKAGDVLAFPEWADQGMLIQFMAEDSENNAVMRTINVEFGESYTIPEHDSMDFYLPIPEGKELVGWMIVKKPTEEPMEVQWYLVRCLQEAGSGSDNPDGSEGDNDNNTGNEGNGEGEPTEPTEPSEPVVPEEPEPDPEQSTTIEVAGTYELLAGQVYTLGEGLSAVEGDTTVYASPIEFTVDADGTYTFYAIADSFQAE